MSSIDRKKLDDTATLTCKDANLRLAEVVTVADVDDEDRVGLRLKLRFGHKAKFLFRL